MCADAVLAKFQMERKRLRTFFLAATIITEQQQHIMLGSILHTRAHRSLLLLY